MKPHPLLLVWSPRRVAPYMGAWIETFHPTQHAPAIKIVAPYMGAWIETAVKPTGYYIPASSDDTSDSVVRSRNAIVSLCVREITQRRISVPDFLREIENALLAQAQTLGDLVHTSTSEPASERQIVHLSRLALSSVITEDESDNIYTQIARGISKPIAHGLISDLRERIEVREESRVASKQRRMAYRDVHHPDQPTANLIRRDESRTRQNWNKAQAEEASHAVYGGDEDD